MVISILFYKFSFTSGIQRKETFMILFNPQHGFLLNLQIALKRGFQKSGLQEKVFTNRPPTEVLYSLLQIEHFNTFFAKTKSKFFFQVQVFYSPLED